MKNNTQQPFKTESGESVVVGSSHCGGSVILSFLVMGKRESWLLYFVCLPGVVWLLVFSGSSSRYRGLSGLLRVILVFPDHTHLLFME